MSRGEKPLSAGFNKFRQLTKKAAPYLAFLAIGGEAAAYFTADLPFRYFEKTVQAPPKKLPPAVQKGVASAMKIYNFDPPQSISEGSAVKIGRNLALTAAHVMVGDDGREKPHCEHVRTQNKYSRGGDSDLVTSTAIDYGGQWSKGPDIALLRISNNPAFDRVPIAPVANHLPKKGDTVYFINYAPTPSGVNRYPNPNATALPLSGTPDESLNGMRHGFDHPAEYAGIVVGHDRGLIKVATSLQGYGSRAGMARNSHNGASGGPVENAAGQVVGLLVQSHMERAQFIDDLNLIHLPVPYSKNIGVSELQPVTPAIVEDGLQYLDAHPIC